MKAVISCIEDLRLKLEKFRKAGMGEAGTKLALINPLLKSLGWDPTDPDQVRVEYLIFGGNFVDYALMMGEKPSLFIEAKQLSDPLSDKGIAEVVRNCALAGVRWCVLTNGVVYKVLCSTEEGPAPGKLLYEVSLDPNDCGDVTVEQVADGLWRFSRESMKNGVLDAIKEEIFATRKVRRALDELFRDPPNCLVNLVRKKTGDQTIKPAQLKNALKRVWPRASDPEPPSKKTERRPERDKVWTRTELLSYLKETRPYQRILLAALAQLDEEPGTGKAVTCLMNEIIERKPSEGIHKNITGRDIAGARAGLTMRRKPIQKEDIIVSSWSPAERDYVYQIKEEHKHIVSDWVKSEGLWIKGTMR